VGARHAALIFLFVFGEASALFAPMIIFREDLSVNLSSQDYWRRRFLSRLKFISVFLPITLLVLWMVFTFW
jgi:hypothetical protein